MAEIPEHLQRRIYECRAKRLTSLDLSSEWDARDEQRLTEIPPEVWEFVWLRELDLSGNHLSEIPEAIGNLRNLVSLNLSSWHTIPDRLKIQKLPESLGNLSALTELNISRNQLTTLPEFLGNLSELKQLNISNNQLADLPESLGNLSSLIELDISKNKLTTLPKSLGNLSALTSLYISNNQFITLPEFIGNLPALTSLYFSSNQLTTFPEFIRNLSVLTSLNFENNKLTTLPEFLGNLPALIHLYTIDNPLEDPPIEIAKKGLEAIREYFRQKREAGQDTLYEAKLLIIGEGEAGKTTLARRIDDPDCPLPNLNESTEGINVIEWHFAREDGKDFRVNIWDFGGQEIYHATHQFFLTKRSLYLLVIDSRKDSPNLSYWLHIVELLSNNSPLVIIKNEKNNYPVSITEAQWRGRFENIKDDSISCNFSDNRGLGDIINAIKYHVQKLPHIGSTLPKTWIRVREALERDDRYYISLEKYLQICNENGFQQEKDALQMSEYLHDIGVILHFQDDPLSSLYKVVILKPKWGTEAVYKVLRSETVKQNRGRFSDRDLGDIWKAPEYATMRGELLALMMKFKLCYELPNERGNYIAPQLLDNDPPPYTWNEKNNLILRYEYEFMPKGILTRFIVDMHRLIEGLNVWGNGVILQGENTHAEIIEIYNQREIKIRLEGTNKRDLLTLITRQFDDIHRGYHRLQFKTLIPCRCARCEANTNPHFYSLETLKKFRSDRQFQIQCQESYAMLDVRNLIDDFEAGNPDRSPKPPIDRRKLLKTLTDLIPAQFNELQFEIDPPAGIVPPPPASQSDRVYALLKWAESPTGCTLEKVQEVLDIILGDR
jgi:internalin A